MFKGDTILKVYSVKNKMVTNGKGLELLLEACTSQTSTPGTEEGIIFP